MTVRVLAFARLRELMAAEISLDVGAGSSVGDAWAALMREYPALSDFAETTRIARNGRLVTATEVLSAGDELALLPPVGGG